MRYAGLIENDFAAAPGISVSFYVQGCQRHCPGCHNPETWDFNGGLEFDESVIDNIVKALIANNINRTFCIQGGEPLCPENEFLTYLVIKIIKERLPNVQIYLWTGYTYEELLVMSNRPKIKEILNSINCLIDGPYIAEERDITLPMRGSRNQRVIYLDNIEKI